MDPDPDPWILMFSGLQNPDPFVRGTVPDVDPSIRKKNEKNLDFHYFVTFYL